jgi:hypothetical protein
MSFPGCQGSRPANDEQIVRLVRALESLVEGELAVTMLVACGDSAVPHLAAFLLEGKPSSVAEPRRRAVRALADLGATDVLIAYLAQPKDHLDPVLRMSEEEVESLAAECLSRWNTDAVFDALMCLAGRRMVLGLCIAFGRMSRVESLPVLAHALADDVCAAAAAEAIRKFGKRAIPALLFATQAQEVIQERETPSSTKRRLAALRLLISLMPAQELWPRVSRLVEEEDPRLAATACLAGMEAAAGQEGAPLAMRLLQRASQVDWFHQGEISECLALHLCDVRHVLETYVAGPTSDPIGRRIAQSLLQREAARPPHQGTPDRGRCESRNPLLVRLRGWTSNAGDRLQRAWRRLAG